MCFSDPLPLHKTKKELKPKIQNEDMNRMNHVLIVPLLKKNFPRSNNQFSLNNQTSFLTKHRRRRRWLF